MKLPKDLLTNLFKKADVYLCETDKSKICRLETSELKGSFKFNGLSEISFNVARSYNDLITGETKVNPYYDKIEALRLIYLENFGYFELQGPEIIGDGIKEIKSCKAYALEYTLSQKYLEDFYINTGENGSVEVTVANGKDIVPVSLYNPARPELSLLHLVLEKDYGNWKIGHVDQSLQTLTRKFEVDRESIYDFLINEVCEKFNCYIVFDTINNTINLYAESMTAKFIANGSSKTFTISPPFEQVNTVSVDGYKTTRWEYNSATGVVTLEETPASGARIEVVDGALAEWETDVFVSFENLSQEINISYDADSIKTVLSVTYGDGGDIREVNFGLPYLTDLSYYYTVDWMGQDLYDAYTKYLQKSNQGQSEYSDNAQRILELQNQISFIKNKQSLGYGVDSSVSPTTVGTYYVISGGSYPNYTYREVSLPSDYNANTVYYKANAVNVTEEKIHTLYSAIRKYFVATHGQVEPSIKDIATKYGTWDGLLEELTDQFKFAKSEYAALKRALTTTASVESATAAIKTFLSAIWTELGSIPLEQLYLKPYQAVQSANISAGYAQSKSEYYWFYYPVTIMIESLNAAINKRNKEIAPLEEELAECQKANAEIANNLLMASNFTQGQLVRLSAFLREDELHLDDIIETDLDDIEGIFKVKQDAMESGRIELQKLCQPQLQFSMSMANIYALPEFEPIINQFQLGKVIKVALRPDYIKQSRLLQVDINFDDFSDFSCEFGELTNLRTQSDIHADLLSKAISAGKSVATNSSYWTRGANVATSTDLKIQQGLLDATTQIKAIDGTQGVIIDKYGIRLTRKDPDTGEIDPHQTWMVNNMILMSDDGFQTSRSALGQVVVDGKEYYGIIAEMVLSGYIEGSAIKGGTIRIGEYVDPESGKTKYAFEVDENGNVTMNAGNKINGYATTANLEFTAGSLQSEFNGKATDLEGKITETNSKITQTANAIRSEVNAKVTDLEGQVTETNSNIEQTAAGIRSEVSETVNGVTTRLSTVEQTVEGITSEVFNEDGSSKIEQTAEKIETEVKRLDESIAQIKIDPDSITSQIESFASKIHHYGTCETAAATQAKVVECEDFKSLVVGASISVYFNNANTANSPTLNVNNTGAKHIAVNRTMPSATSQYSWSAQSMLTFVYDGAFWTVSDSGALSKIKQTADSITLLVETTDDLQSQITVNANSISSKVGSDNIGTLIEQNANAVKVSWNKNSNYIQLENGEMNIYNSTSSSRKPLMKLHSSGLSTYDTNGNLLMRTDGDGLSLYNTSEQLMIRYGRAGQTFYYNGSEAGYLEGTVWTGTAHRGLSYSILNDSSYLAWASKGNMKWIYTEKTIGDYAKGLLHAGTDIDMHDHVLKNVSWEDGGTTGTLSFYAILSINDDGTADTWKAVELKFKNGILVDVTN